MFLLVVQRDSRLDAILGICRLSEPTGSKILSLNRCCLMAFSGTSSQISVSSTTLDGMAKLSSDNFLNLPFAISLYISSRGPVPD